MQKMLLFIGLLALGAFLFGYYFDGITGNVISGDESKSFTKAICNNGQCLDVYVECSQSGMKITPITPYHPVDMRRFNITNEISC